MQALQGEGPAGAGLLPEEEEDDVDFLVDLDELTGGCQEDLLPTLPTSPLQTRFKRCDLEVSERFRWLGSRKRRDEISKKYFVIMGSI